MKFCWPQATNNCFLHSFSHIQNFKPLHDKQTIRGLTMKLVSNLFRESSVHRLLFVVGGEFPL